MLRAQQRGPLLSTVPLPRDIFQNLSISRLHPNISFVLPSPIACDRRNRCASYPISPRPFRKSKKEEETRITPRPSFPRSPPNRPCACTCVRAYARAARRNRLQDNSIECSLLPSTIMSYGGGYPPYGRKWRARPLGRNLISRGAS